MSENQYGTFDRKGIVQNTISLTKPLLKDISHLTYISKEQTTNNGDSKKTIINISEYLKKRDNWETSDDDILNNKLKQIHAYKRLYASAKIAYQRWDTTISVISMIFAGIIPIISTASLLNYLPTIIINIINIICGMLSVILHVMAKTLNYKSTEISSAKIITECLDIENYLGIILQTNPKDRDSPVQIIDNIDKMYITMVNNCTNINISNSIINIYKKEITKEIKQKKLSTEQEDNLINIYLTPTGKDLIML